MEINTRKEAYEKGLYKYYTGRPCAKGHDVMRYTKTGACLACIKGYVRKYNVANKKLNDFKTVNKPIGNGWVEVTIKIHPTDLDLIMDVVKNLAIARLDAQELEVTTFSHYIKSQL